MCGRGFRRSTSLLVVPVIHQGSCGQAVSRYRDSARDSINSNNLTAAVHATIRIGHLPEYCHESARRPEAVFNGPYDTLRGRILRISGRPSVSKEEDFYARSCSSRRRIEKLRISAVIFSPVANSDLVSTTARWNIIFAIIHKYRALRDVFAREKRYGRVHARGNVGGSAFGITRINILVTRYKAWQRSLARTRASPSA